MITTGPYRFADPAAVTSDVSQLRTALEQGEVTRALNIYRQPLLRSSDLLTIEEWRSELDRETAEAVRRSGDARIETRWSHTEMGHAYRRG